MTAVPSEFSDAARRRVRAALANLRREPRHASELVSQLVMGEKAVVLEETPGWVRVQGADGYPGWVDSRALADGAGTGAEVVWTRRQGLLRDAPDGAAAPICDLTLGARAWAGDDFVRLADGRHGWADVAAAWVPAGELPSVFPRDGAAVAATGLALRGVPYLWGGTSSKAFDCSGLVQRVFRLHGVALPRDAWQQAGVGRPVEAGPDGAGLAAGDLLLFAERGDRVTHVALALGRRGRFVHSSTSRAGVEVDGLDPADEVHSPSLAATLAGCRRVL